MEIVFLLFGIISLLLIVDGNALKKQERIRPLLRQFKLGKDERKNRFFANFMILAGGITLIWTVIGYFLYDLLILPIFIIVYLLLLFLVAGIGSAVWKKKN